VGLNKVYTMNKQTSVEVLRSEFSKAIYFGDTYSYSWIQPSEIEDLLSRFSVNECYEADELYRAYQYLILVDLGNRVKCNIVFTGKDLILPCVSCWCVWLLLHGLCVENRYNLFTYYGSHAAYGRPKATSIRNLSRVNPWLVVPEWHQKILSSGINVMLGDRSI